MNENNKPQAINLGQSVDGESITDNYSDLDRLIGDPKFIYGKSSPLVTDDDLAEIILIPDRNFTDSYTATNLHLKALGLTPIWSRFDYARVQRHKWQTASWKSYLAVAR